ncbi:hypothetical protein [Methanobacterium sp.]|uniref:hypothetical protein n=1 Tax=Methanobacterium sp. TaxID=2164 RepID=UPI002AB86B35|nr:hypothetical protein [Methanobacterium sp.]MDY9922762.1 hypothetical protein [Methanobacterium sp.]
MLISVISNLKSKSISESLESIMANIFLMGLIATIVLTILLSIKWIPDYFNSLYILFGSIIVAAIGFYLNSRLENEKEQRKIKRFMYVVNDNINTNKKIIEKLKIDLDNSGGTRLDGTLNIGFFDILSSEIISMDLNPEFVRDLIKIKELTFNMNDLIQKRNIVLHSLDNGLHPEIDLPDRYSDLELDELSQLNKMLTDDLEIILKKSSQFLINYQIF